MGCPALSAACRSAGVCSTSYGCQEQQGAARWRLQPLPGRRRQMAAAAAAAAAAVGAAGAGQAAAAPPVLPGPSRGSRRSSVMPAPTPGSMPRSRRRSAACHAFGDNLRRLGNRGGKPSVGEQSRDDPNGNGSAAGPDQNSVWSDWQADSTSQDWEAWEGINVADLDDVTEVEELREAVIERRRMRAGRRSKVRDEYIRPIVDAQGIVNRLIVDEAEAEERVFVEAITNQYESREAIKYLGALIGIPLAVGFVVSRFIATPLWEFAEGLDPAAFAPNEYQKIEGAHELHLEELRLRMEASLGQAPPLTDEAMFEHLHHTAKHLDHEFREANKRALLNVVSDVTSGLVFFTMLSQQVPERQILFRTVGRIFTGLSDTSKAFLIILITDILLGYHSEEGWTATLRILSGHYGLEAEDELIHIFVATVPVLLDSLFKVWIFVGLNKADPAAAVTLRQMDRH